MRSHSVAAAVLLALSCSLRVLAATPEEPPPQPPSIEFGELYRAVELAQLFPDQKTFADAVPKMPPAKVMSEYDEQKRQPGFDLKAFVTAHFAAPPRYAVDAATRPARPIRDYLDAMWQVLQRKPDAVEPYSSLLPLSRPYIVPGGRFSEIYYWDSYFTMLGLEQDGQSALAADMLSNLASLIDRFGHVPNGNRSYYLSRSQPPFFACMVELIAAHDGEHVLVDRLPELQAEHDYWMEGAESLAPGQAHRRVLRLADGTLLNRYWDDRDEPRDESYLEDVRTAQQAKRPAAEIYRELRAGAETGWDYSSRWLADGRTLATIRTTAIAPIDLNSLMQHQEQVLARAYRLKGDAARAGRYQAMAEQRAAAIRRLMWNGKGRLFVDYLWQEAGQSTAISAATIYPLFFRIATQEQAHAVARTLRRDFLGPGGLDTTRVATGQQWDRPNGWAPLQYLAVAGLNAYGERALAREIATRWIRRNLAGYRDIGVLVEKYDVDKSAGRRSGGSGGEYALQPGFGWTNGVLAKLLAEYPKLAQ
ncbi:MAG: alpha,alpha-trehalase TreA [Aliidongia sp.]